MAVNAIAAREKETVALRLEPLQREDLSPWASTPALLVQGARSIYIQGQGKMIPGIEPRLVNVRLGIDSERKVTSLAFYVCDNTGKTVTVSSLDGLYHLPEWLEIK